MMVLQTVDLNRDNEYQTHSTGAIVSDYILKLDENEAAHIAQRAKERGYAALMDYLRALVAADELVEVLRDDWQNADTGADEIETNFRESWHEAMTGNVLPIESLWDGLDDDE